MNDLIVLVPSRGRPANVNRLYNAWDDTGADAGLLVAIDGDDPERANYKMRQGRLLTIRERKGLAGTLNDLAATYATSHRYIGFMGDDHLPRTQAWDKRIVEALDELGTGIVYGNDLFQGERLPTAVFMTSDIVRAVGYMCPPGFKHLYVDNVWKAWGEGLGRIRYLPNVVIEHLHPMAAGKSEWDDGYRQVNSGDTYSHDGHQWETYKTGSLQSDLEKLRALL